MFFLYKYIFFCLLITILIEISLAFLLKVRDKKDLINIALVNMMTNPLVVAIPTYLNFAKGYNYSMFSYYALELFAVISEGYVYSKYLNYKKINPYLLSFILNLTSFLLGEIASKI